MKIIEFTDNVTRLYDKDVPVKGPILSTEIKNFLKETADSDNQTLRLIPPGLRYVNSDQSLIIFEQQPCVRDLVVPGEYDEVEEMTIPLPWVIFVFYTFNHKVYSFIFFNYTPISTPVDTLYSAYLPNVYLNNQICFDQIEPFNFGIDDVSSFISEFWASPFNYDLIDYQCVYEDGIGIFKSMPLDTLMRSNNLFATTITLEDFINGEIKKCLIKDEEVGYQFENPLTESSFSWVYNRITEVSSDTNQA